MCSRPRPFTDHHHCGGDREPNAAELAGWLAVFWTVACLPVRVCVFPFGN